MMSSRFSPGRGSTPKPPYCKKPQPDMANRYVDGLPKFLNAFAAWRSSAADVDTAQSFPLARNDALPGWTGSSGDVGTNLTVQVVATDGDHLFNFRLAVRDGTVELYWYTWPAVDVGRFPPFNSTLLNHTWASGLGRARLLVLD